MAGFDVTGADICRIIHDYGLENTIFMADNSMLFTSDSESKSVTMIHLFNHPFNTWPDSSDWPDNFEELSPDEQSTIYDDFHDKFNIWHDSNKEFQRVQVVPLSMFYYFH